VAAPLLLKIALAAVLFAWLSHTRTDPDLWGHVRFGHDIVSTRGLPATDGYSFLSDRPWINHEWLSECVMYAAYAVAGPAGLVALKVLLLVGVLGAVFLALGRQSVTGASRDLLLAVVVLGTFGQINHMRPQVFSLAAFSWLLVLLTAVGSRRARLALIPALFAVWVNLHGGWIVGGAALALWTTCTLGAAVPRGEKLTLVGCGVLSLLATLLNPYGVKMWLFLWTTVGFGRAEITEWQPVFRLGAPVLIVWSVVAVAALIGGARAFARSGSQPAVRRVAVVLFLGLASFQVSRLRAFFAIAVVVLLGRELAAALERFRRQREAATPGRAAAAAAAAIACALIAGGGVAVARNVGCVRMDSPGLPDPVVRDYIRTHQLRGRLAVWFDWGEYAIWHFSPALSVSVDGRRETVYSDGVLRRHLMFYYVPSTRQQFLEEVRPDYIWVPSNLPVVAGLRSDGWKQLAGGPSSVLLGRSGDEQARAAFSPMVAGSRCFPGP
jgi:hypothetical protein